MTRVLLVSQDPLFTRLCQRALAGSRFELAAAVPPAQLLEATRKVAPELVVIDVDAEDLVELKALTTKLLLRSEARLVLTAAYLGPGSPGLCALLQAIAAGFVQKPQGTTSLGLADEDAAPFVAALAATLHPDMPRPRTITVPPDIDSGWESDQ